MVSWNEYRRQYVNPAGFTKDSPGVWTRTEEDGTETEFQPFRYSAAHRKQAWQVLAEQGKGPDWELEAA